MPISTNILEGLLHICSRNRPFAGSEFDCVGGLVRRTSNNSPEYCRIIESGILKATETGSSNGRPRVFPFKLSRLCMSMPGKDFFVILLTQITHKIIVSESHGIRFVKIGCLRFLACQGDEDRDQKCCQAYRQWNIGRKMD